MLNFLEATLKDAKINEINFNNIFHLAQYFQNVTIV